MLTDDGNTIQASTTSKSESDLAFCLSTNETGGIVQRLAYDAWGKRRNVSGTDAANITAQDTRGYTAHEHDDEVALINMNAREYDPIIARFISPDSIIPGALSSQAYNRYTYTNNNPLSYTDPSGHWSLRKAAQNVARAAVMAVTGPGLVGAKLAYEANKAAYNAYSSAHKYVKRHVDQTLMDHQWARTALMAASFICAPYCTAAAATYMAHISGASNQDALKSGAKAYVASDIMSPGDVNSSLWYEQAVFSGVKGGVASTVQGGSFTDGFRTTFMIETLSMANLQMRKTVIEWAGRDPRNKAFPAGLSKGIGDGIKTAGAYYDELTGACGSPTGGCQGEVGEGVKIFV
jgi:RHS repeat-associated protein